MRIRHAMLLAALAPAASCVEQPRYSVSREVPPRVTTARQLLRELAPDAPDQALPTAVAAARLGPVSALPVRAAPAFLAGAQTTLDAARAADCLTAAVYYEARSEPLDGQRAVAQVVLNRVRDRAFPHSVCGVVYQGVGRGRGCQFSFACDGSTRHAIEPSAWDVARRVAETALAGSVYAPVGSATFYHTGAVSPWWAPTLARIGMIGAHIFYRWPSAMERVLAFRTSYSGVEPQAPETASAPVFAATGDQGGVTVHRGSTTSGTPLPAMAAAAPPPIATAMPVTHVARVTMAAGVRVHVNGGMARHLVVTPDANGAVVGEETDPI